jgi:hypothetical protein
VTANPPSTGPPSTQPPGTQPLSTEPLNTELIGTGAAQHRHIPEGLVPTEGKLAERRWITDTVIDWLEGGPERIFLLTGDAGSGKSVLSGHLAGRPDWDGCFFCSDRYVGASTDPRTFVRDVSDQLRLARPSFEAELRSLVRPVVHGEAHADVALGEVTAVRINQLFLEAKSTSELYDLALGSPLAATLSRDERPLALLIDGLDESPAIAELVGQLARLPGPLKLFVTSQNERDVTDEFRSLLNTTLRQVDLSAAALSDRVDEDIERFARNTGVGDGSVFAARRVRDTARGNFLVARAALDELAAGTPPAELESVVGGDLGNQHERHLVRLLERQYGAGWREAWDGLSVLFGLLAVAKGPVPISALARWLERSERDVGSALDRFDGVLRRAAGTVRLYHSALAATLLASELPDGSPNRVCVDSSAAHRRIVECTLALVRREGWAACDDYALLNLPAHLAGQPIEPAFELLASPEYRRELVGRVPDPITASGPYRRLGMILLASKRYDLLERFLPDVVGSELPGIRTSAIEILLAYAAESATTARNLITKLAVGQAAAGRLVVLRAAMGLPREEQAAVFDNVVTGGSSVSAREVAYAMYLNWNSQPAKLTGGVLQDLAGRVSLRPPWRGLRARLEFLSEVTVTNYVNHLGDPAVIELTSAIWQQVLVERLHVDVLSRPLLDRVVAPAVALTVAGRIFEATTGFDRARTRELFPFQGPEADAASRVVQRLDPARNVLELEADLTLLLNSEFVLFRILAAQVLAVHAVDAFATVDALLQRLFSRGSARVRAWLIVSLGVLVPEAPASWLAPLERMTEEVVGTDPSLAAVREDRMLGEFDLLFFPLGLAYARAGSRLVLHERLLLAADTDPSVLASCVTGIAVTGLYFPEAALAAFEPVVAADERFLQAHALAALGLIANVHPTLVQLWLARWNAARLYDAIAAMPLDAAHRYMELIGMYANGVHQSLHYPLMREHLHISVFTNLLAARSPQQWISGYARTALAFLRDADYTLVNWTKAP